MPRTKRPDPIYQRGDFRLYAREGRNLEIVRYDASIGRERSSSARTTDVQAASAELDRLFLESRGETVCPHCHRPYDGTFDKQLLQAMTDYNVLSADKPSAKAIKSRLAQVYDYLVHIGKTEITCSQLDEAWIGKYRTWGLKQEYRAGVTRSPATVEASIATLAAAINATKLVKPNFRPIPLKEVNRPIVYRAGIPELAAMFRFCLHPTKVRGESKEKYAARIKRREPLLHFLRGSVATWGRPDAVHDINTDPKRRQWLSNARVLNLNYHGRKQTKKYRATVPIAKQFAPHLDETKGEYIPVNSVRKAWEAMAAEIGLPGDGESGLKLIRRSMATLARPRIGEANWRQGEMMLGHVKHNVSDIYALPDPANLGLALAATEAIIDEIDKACPGAFYRKVTAQLVNVVPLKG